MTTNLNQKLLCAAAAAVAGLTFVTASAAQAQTASREVSYADLNMKSDAGKATFTARVRGAAEAVCNTGGQTLREIVAQKKCVESAVQTAMTKAASIS